MRKLIVLGALLVACRGSVTPTPTPAGGSGPGAATAAAAIGAFMTAAKAEDLQALALVWGDETGSVRDRWPRQEVEMRAVYLVKCLRHDKYTVLNEASGTGGKRLINVQITAGRLTRSTKFTLTPGPQSRWYVENLELAPLDDICLMKDPVKPPVE